MTESAKLLEGLKSNRLETPHLMLTRANGISPQPFASLNVSFNVGDTRENVLQNREKIKETLGIRHLVSAGQIHGDKIHTVHSVSIDREIAETDALITSQSNIGLLIQQADCQAILLYDPVQKVIGAVHCGWRGSVLNIIGKTIVRMHHEYRTNPADLQAAISPSMGPCCAEFINYQRELPQHLHKFQTRPFYFDFWEMSRHQLLVAGVVESNIDMLKICTTCDRRFFSYRRSTKKGSQVTGRQGSVILLSP